MGLIRSGNTDLTPMDDDLLTAYLWPIVREIIKTVIENEQNLIVEGCYIPFDWRKDLEERYLGSIRFFCLVMTGHYIDTYFQEIVGYGSAIESRLEEDCTAAGLKADNMHYREGFLRAGEQVVYIDTGYEQTIEGLLAGGMEWRGDYAGNDPLCGLPD